MRGILFCCLILVNLQSLAQSRYRKDFDFYWQTIKENYAYFDKQVTDWNKVKTIYQPISDTISSTNSFVRFLEIVNNELYNGHIFLNTNTSSSNRTIPTGSDLNSSRPIAHKNN